MSGPARLPDWDTLAGQLPDVVATMRRYLDQLQYVLRPRTVVNTELALRSLAAFLAEQTPQVTTVAAVSRRHIEDFKPWLAARRVCCIEPSLAILTGDLPAEGA